MLVRTRLLIMTAGCQWPHQYAHCRDFAILIPFIPSCSKKIAPLASHLCSYHPQVVVEVVHELRDEGQEGRRKRRYQCSHAETSNGTHARKNKHARTCSTSIVCPSASGCRGPSTVYVGLSFLGMTTRTGCVQTLKRTGRWKVFIRRANWKPAVAYGGKH